MPQATPHADRRIGLTLPNRGALFGVTSPQALFRMAEQAEASGLVDSVWVGDGVVCKPRPDSIVMLAGLAARTERLRLAVGCFASFIMRHPVLLATQWASLDLVAGGRTVLTACLGGIGPGADEENAAFGIRPGERVGRLLEGIELLRRLWSEENVSHEGRFYTLRNLSVQPRPAAVPPIWIANNVRGNVGESDAVKRSLRRVARHADGWMTNGPTPEEFAARLDYLHEAMREEGRDPANLDTSLYFNVNLKRDRDEAIDETQRFLETYYEQPWPPERLARWTALGSADEAIAHLNRYYEAGVREITLRITSWDQQAQFDQLLGEIFPALKSSAQVRA
ncbi:MAG: LLM class flavin-dependent oxidoreductase [Dehalococcoidia bacterium]